MALTVFPFARSVRPRCAEWPDFQTRRAKLTGGYTERSADYGTDFLLRAVFSLEFPQRSTGKTLTDLLSFIEAHRGAAGTFLLSFYTDRYRELRGLVLGTGNGTQVDFAVTHKYLNASTLVVRKAGVVQGSGYSLIANETAPVVRFTSAPGVGQQVDIDVDFYVPVHFEADSLEVVLRAAFATDAKRSVRIDSVQVEEAQPGARLV